LAPQLVVQTHHLADGPWRQALQPAAQCGLIGELLQTEQRQKRPVVLQDVGLVETTQASDDGQQQCQQQVGGPVISTAVEEPHGALEPPPQLESLTKTLYEHQAAEVRQMRLVERKPQCLQAFWHRQRVVVVAFSPRTQTSLKGRKESNGLEPPFASILPALPASPPGQFMHF
jgi:hypothetical protein